MIDNFIACIGFSLRQEGGYCDVKGDSGGATNHGITMATLSIFLQRQATISDVQKVSDIQAEQIYKPFFWSPINGDLLRLGIDLMTLDFGITSGPQTSARMLQRVLGVTPDGWIGQQTISALASRSAADVIARLSNSQQAYYSSLNGFAEFGEGWLARGVRRRTIALAMAAAG